MSRAAAIAVVLTLQKYSPLSATFLARECRMDAANAREWLYELEKQGAVRRQGNRTQAGKSSGRSHIVWEWVPFERVEKVSKQVEIDCKVRRETDKAIYIDTGKDTCTWIPRSQITDECEDSEGNITSIFIPEWLAIEKGLV